MSHCSDRWHWGYRKRVVMEHLSNRPVLLHTMVVLVLPECLQPHPSSRQMNMLPQSRRPAPSHRS